MAKNKKQNLNKNSNTSKSIIKPNVKKNNYSAFILPIILILTFIAYYNSLKNNFISSWDDYPYVMDNFLIQSLSFQNIKLIFNTNTFVGANYHPITILSYAIDFSLFKLNPHAYHLENLIFHLLNVTLVYYLINLISNKKSVAIITSLLFAIHPMHVESVAWIAERKDVLYTFFFLISLIFYTKYLIKKNNYLFLIISILTFILSLFSKPAAVCLPGIILLLNYYYKRKLELKLYIEIATYSILALIFGMITMKAQNVFGAFNDILQYNFIDKIFLFFYSIYFYVYKLFIPINLSAMHYYPNKNGSMLPIEYYLSPIFVLLIVFAIIKFENYRKILIFGLLFYFITVFLAIQVKPFIKAVGAAMVSERYSYVPYIGLFFIIGQLYSDIEEKKIKLFKNSKQVFLGVIVIFSLWCMFLTWERNKLWKDSITLFTDTTIKYPKSSEAYSQLASAFIKEKDYENTIISATNSINLNNSNINSLYNRAISYYNFKNYKGAITDLDNAIKNKPSYTEAYMQRGLCKQAIGDFKGSIDDYTKAIEQRPNYVDAFINRGSARSYFGDLNGSIEDYNRAIQINPNIPEIYNNIGFTLQAQKKFKESIPSLSKAIEINPKFMMAYFNRGNAKYNIQDYNGAIEDYSKTIELDQTYSFAYINRGLAKLNIDKKFKNEACMDWNKALSLGNQQGGSLLNTYCK